MKIFDITKRYDEEKLYNINDVAAEFLNYYNMSLEELENYFSNYYIIDKEELINYLKEEYNNSNHSQEIINNRILEYEYHNKVLKILSNKALRYLLIIKYLCEWKEYQEEYEKILKNAQIYHYSNIVIGKTINKFLIPLFHILERFKSTLNVINNKENFLFQNMSTALLLHGDEEIYPNEQLVITDDYYGDKTSIKIKKRS